MEATYILPLRHEKVMAITHLVFLFSLCTGTVPHHRLQKVAVQGGGSYRSNGNKKPPRKRRGGQPFFPYLDGRETVRRNAQLLDRLLYERVLPFEENHSHFTLRTAQRPVHQQAEQPQGVGLAGER